MKNIDVPMSKSSVVEEVPANPEWEPNDDETIKKIAMCVLLCIGVCVYTRVCVCACVYASEGTAAGTTNSIRSSGPHTIRCC